MARENSTHDGQLGSVVRSEDQFGGEKKGNGVELTNRPVIWGNLRTAIFFKFAPVPFRRGEGRCRQVFDSPIR